MLYETRRSLPGRDSGRRARPTDECFEEPVVSDREEARMGTPLRQDLPLPASPTYEDVVAVDRMVVEAGGESVVEEVEK